jgi:outer membrane protein assembly factor BamB
VAVVVTAVGVTAGDLRSTPEPAAPVQGWRVVRSVEVPGSGSAIVGDGSLWVVNQAAHRLTADGTAPAGDLYELDPTSGDIRDRIPGGVGGWPAVGGGAVWLMTAAGDLNVLTRVDLTTHEVTRTKTSHPRTLPHGVAVVGNTLWVASYETGDLILMDAHTLAVRQRMHLGGPATGGAPGSVVTDGTSVWVSDANAVVTRFDAATEAPISHLQLPTGEIRLDGIDSRGVLYGHGSGNAIFTIVTGAGDAPDQFGQELHLTTETDSTIAGVTLAGGSIWVAMLNPDELLRVDPQSFEVTARTPLVGLNHRSNTPVAIAATDDAVWVRVDGKVVEVAP